MPRPTIRQIAQKAGVSVSSASYALRQHANVSREMHQKVAQAAAELGYIPDPRLMSLMAHVRAARLNAKKEILSLIWPEQSVQATKEFQYFHWIRDGVRTRARQLGFEIEEFWPNEQHMSLPRLLDVLFARGIYGAIFAPASHPPAHLETSDFSRIAVSKIGLAEWPVKFHLSAHNHFMGMTIAMRELKKQGYKRPAALIRNHVHEINYGAYAAAFRQNHPCLNQTRGQRPDRLFMLLHEENYLDAAKVTAWLSEEKPDVLICSDSEPWPSFMSSRMPTLPWVSLLASSKTSGIDQELPNIASNAVDLVMEQLNHNERGIPPMPKNLLTNGHWVYNLKKSTGHTKSRRKTGLACR